MVPGGGGRGGTDSLSLGTDLKNRPPSWPQTAPGFAISNVTAPSFHGSSRTAPTNCHFWMNLFVYFNLINYSFLEQLLMHTFVIRCKPLI